MHGRRHSIDLCMRGTNLLSMPGLPCAARVASSAKKTGGKLGLGVKKLESKMDDSIFSQVSHRVTVAGYAVCARV